ncbi:hypothetical protein F4782DRAFT_503888 [Xylaria castorea]|nr:hypothetical protein F4782DRAFT_503888 [Xylaria castorea]
MSWGAGYQTTTTGSSEYSTMTPSTKVRAPRLRASCDGCFLAKVKCSKQRPMCSRCLACGISCNYSPSSRAGKPKPESSLSPGVSTVHGVVTVHNTLPMQSYPGDDAAPYLSQTTPDQAFPLEGWGTPATSGDGPMVRNCSMASDMSEFGLDENGMAQLDPTTAAHPQYFQPHTPWEPNTNMHGRIFPEVSTANTQIPFVQSQLFDPSMHSYVDQQQQDTNLYAQAQASPSVNLNYLPSPNTTPVVQPTMYHHQNGRTCGCFAGCLQSLLNLHNASAHDLVPFEILWNINDKAVDGCATIMACKTCFSQSGGETSVMLLATIFLKVASSYRDAIRRHCGNTVVGMPESTPNGIMGDGTYPQNSEQAILARTNRLYHAVQKLEEHFSTFRMIHQSSMRHVVEDIAGTIHTCRSLLDFIRSNSDSNIFGVVSWGDNIKDEVLDHP